jgi:hypothetical protein
MASTNQLLKKAKQAARREARVMANEYMESLTPSYFAKHYTRPKPKYIPKFIWSYLVRLVTWLKSTDIVRIAITPKQAYHLLNGDEVATNGSRIICGDFGPWVIKSILNQLTRENEQ